jgi:hypothetical protein
MAEGYRIREIKILCSFPHLCRIFGHRENVGMTPGDHCETKRRFNIVTIRGLIVIHSRLPSWYTVCQYLLLTHGTCFSLFCACCTSFTLQTSNSPLIFPFILILSHYPLFLVPFYIIPPPPKKKGIGKPLDWSYDQRMNLEKIGWQQGNNSETSTAPIQDEVESVPCHKFQLAGPDDGLQGVLRRFQGWIANWKFTKIFIDYKHHTYYAIIIP